LTGSISFVILHYAVGGVQVVRFDAAAAWKVILIERVAASRIGFPDRGRDE
jgi:hypothetical protein